MKSEIIREVEAGNICISNFDHSRCGSNSYDLTLQPVLFCYTQAELDMDKPNPVRRIDIPVDGYVLVPGEFYIGATNETATSKKYVPLLEGRSSVARLGITVHAASGYGDLWWGYDYNDVEQFPTWTLELYVIKPVRIYANRRVCQAIFAAPQGDPEDPRNRYPGKYSTQKLPQPSLMWEDTDTHQVGV